VPDQIEPKSVQRGIVVKARYNQRFQPRQDAKTRDLAIIHFFEKFDRAVATQSRFPMAFAVAPSATSRPEIAIFARAT